MNLADGRAILALDPTSRGLAFTFFESGELLDWGTRHVEGNDLSALDRILDLCPANVLVIEDVTAARCLRRARVRKVLGVIEREAKSRGLDVRKVSAYDALRAWEPRGCVNKGEIAQAMARDIPELELLLPRPRGKYRSEQARMSIFDAASLALYAFRPDPKGDRGVAAFVSSDC